MTAGDLDERILEHLRMDAEAAAATLAAYEARASCCRMVSVSLIRQTVGQASPRSLGMEQTGRYTWHCPKCNRCVLDES